MLLPNKDFCSKTSRRLFGLFIQKSCLLFFSCYEQGAFVVYFDQQTGALHTVCWLKSSFWAFYLDPDGTSLCYTDCVLMIYCVLNNNTFKLFLIEHIVK